jgi:hypothetical protein
LSYYLIQLGHVRMEKRLDERECAGLVGLEVFSLVPRNLEETPCAPMKMEK